MRRISIPQILLAALLIMVLSLTLARLLKADDNEAQVFPGRSDRPEGGPLKVSLGVSLPGGGFRGAAPGALSSGNACAFGEPDYAAYCQHANGNFGWFGSQFFGVYGDNSGTFGFLGGDSYGAYGKRFNGNYGYLGGTNEGVFGWNANGNVGYLAGISSGVYGSHANGNSGRLGSNSYGAYGEHDNGNFGGFGSIDYGTYGEHTNGHWGYLGGTSTGVQGRNTNGNFGILGSTNYAVRGFAANGFAGYFQGNVHIIGTLTGGAAAFKVDHPLDPANRYLSHSVVESPEMKTVYDGTTTLDAAGEAFVEMPSYFEALNRDFRYQLTAIGAPGPNLYIAEEIQGNRFKIAGGVSGMKVSWQVTGIRQDPWAEAHRVVVEEAKPVEERGYYLHPQLYGQPAERSVEWGRDPEGMRALQEMPQRREAERRRREQERRQIDQEHERMKTAREQRPFRPDDQR